MLSWASLPLNCLQNTQHGMAAGHQWQDMRRIMARNIAAGQCALPEAVLQNLRT